jgi:hypothetical protein
MKKLEKTLVSLSDVKRLTAANGLVTNYLLALKIFGENEETNRLKSSLERAIKDLFKDKPNLVSMYLSLLGIDCKERQKYE